MSEEASAYVYAKSVFELHDGSKYPLWTSDQKAFDEIFDQISEPWYDLYQQWLKDPSGDNQAKAFARQRYSQFLGQAQAPVQQSPVDVAQNNYAPINMPQPDAVTKHDTIASTTDTIREMTQFRGAQREYANAVRQANPPAQMPPASSDQTQFMNQLILALVGDRNQPQPKDDPLVVLKQLELTERSNERARQDQQMMLQLMQQNSDRNMQMMFELMRGNGSRSTIEEQIMTHAVSRMLDPPEERGGSSTLWQDISESGVLEKVSAGIGTVLGNMRQVPAGTNPYAQQLPPQQMTPQDNMLQYANMNPSAAVEQIVHTPVQVPTPAIQQPQVIAQEPQVSFDDKCAALYEKSVEMGLNNPVTVGIQATPEQWNAILANSITVAVQRGEFNFPSDIDAQMSQALGELNIVLNARRLAGLLGQIQSGALSLDQVASVAKGNPLFEMVQQLGTDGVLALMQDYANIDGAGIKIIGWDIEHLLSPENRPVIQQVLSAVN